jgi:hypothetical protein
LVFFCVCRRLEKCNRTRWIDIRRNAVCVRTCVEMTRHRADPTTKTWRRITEIFFFFFLDGSHTFWTFSLFFCRARVELENLTFSRCIKIQKKKKNNNNIITFVGFTSRVEKHGNKTWLQDCRNIEKRKLFDNTPSAYTSCAR